ncbi:hypothetical protein G6F35_012277 [Rhizopus arrhizus]|nr:hypothetical protein G6F24_013637 [Rhizopus arrhizus]KAG0778216.1 hypothetical protein G6F21_013076 [Rhizopus arrhizus]KAG1201566.1 hypothetical protein G6F35_012277 [Rhizopus arrhizus]
MLLGITLPKSKHLNTSQINNVNSVEFSAKLRPHASSNHHPKTKVSNTFMSPRKPEFQNIAAILIHNDFEQEFKDLLRHHNVPIKDDFKPFSGTILADPKYADLSSEERDSIATELQKTRLSRALDHIRPPVKYAVARYFLDQHWIPRSKFDYIIAERYNPKVSAIFAQTHSSQPNHTEEEDFVMDTQEETAIQNLLSSGTDTPVRH